MVNVISSPIIILFLVSGLSFILLMLKVRNEYDSRVGSIFFYLTLLGALWVLANLLELVFTSTFGTLFWGKIKYIGIVFLPVTWLLFALEYTGRIKLVTKKNTMLLSIIPVLNLFFQWSNSFHNLFYQKISIEQLNGITFYTVNPGPMYWFNALYSYTLLLIGVIIIIYSLTSLHKSYWKPAMLLSFGAMTPLIGNIVYNLTKIIEIDITPILLSITSITMYYGIKNFNFLGALIVGRKTVFDNITDPILVLDKQKNIIDLNKSGEKLLNKIKPKEKYLRKNAEKLFKNEKSLKKIINSSIKIKKVIKIEIDKKIRHYHVQMNPLRENQKEKIGWTLILRDITEREETKDKKDFLYTLFRQDLTTKFQVIQGYLSLLKDLKVPEDYENYLKKGLKTGKEADQILKLIKKLEKLEKTDWYAKKDIKNIIKQSKQDLKELTKENNVQINVNHPKNLEKVIGNYSLKTLIKEILKLRIEDPKVNKININIENQKENLKLIIKDNGNNLPKETIKFFKGDQYTGKTTGIAGVRYYTLKEIARHNKLKIKVNNQEQRGVKFQINLKKATK